MQRLLCSEKYYPELIAFAATRVLNNTTNVIFMLLLIQVFFLNLCLHKSTLTNYLILSNLVDGFLAFQKRVNGIDEGSNSYQKEIHRVVFDRKENEG